MSISPRSLLLALCVLLPAGMVAIPTLAAPPAGADRFDAEDVEDMHDDLDVDVDDYDPAEHVRRQLQARQPEGSGGPQQACVIAGRLVIPALGVNEDVRDCMQSNGRYSVAEFAKACEGLGNAFVQMGSAPAKIEYVQRCPVPAQGSCRNMGNTGMDGFYYQRRGQSLTSLPASCTSMGGTWVPAR